MPDWCRARLLGRYPKISSFHNHSKESELSVTLIIRQKDSRRRRLAAKYPLTDSLGLIVIHDRRRLPDRREKSYGINDLKVILSKMGCG